MGLPFWMGQGFGLGLSVVLDPQAQAWMGPSSKGAISWPGAFGTWWRADPQEDMIAIYLIQNSMPLGPEAAAQIAASPRMGGRLALITFLNLLYGALGR
jgi:CubicO group peptidase (beta-lactamase class C family)